MCKCVSPGLPTCSPVAASALLGEAAAGRAAFDVPLPWREGHGRTHGKSDPLLSKGSQKQSNLCGGSPSSTTRMENLPNGGFPSRPLSSPLKQTNDGVGHQPLYLPTPDSLNLRVAEPKNGR